MKHYRTQLIKSQMFHCRIFIEYLRNCFLKAQCPSQILPPAHVFDIRCSVGSHPTNCHRFWDTFWCTWTLKTDWISDWYQNCLCVWAQYKVLHYQLCPAVRVSAEGISGACTVYSIVHLAHIAHTVSIVVTPLHAIWCRSQYFGRRVNEYSDVVHLTKTYKFYKTRLYKFRVQRLHYAFVSSSSTH